MLFTLKFLTILHVKSMIYIYHSSENCNHYSIAIMLPQEPWHPLDYIHAYSYIGGICMNKYCDMYHNTAVNTNETIDCCDIHVQCKELLYSTETFTFIHS